MAFVIKVVKFVQSPQGKRDLTLVTAAASAIVSVLKQFGVL